MIPDPYEKDVALPVRVFEDGTVEFFYGGPLPVLKKECIGVLRIPQYAMADSIHLTALTSEAGREILPAGERLRVTLSCQPDGQRSYSHDGGMEYVEDRGASFTWIKLLSPVRLRISLGKRASLEPCRVLLESIATEAGSLNQALTMLSEVLEPTRLSRGGNAFRRILKEGKGPRGVRWHPLEQLRAAAEAEHEEYWLGELKKNGVPIRY
ncbi:MAG: hypothetical protein IPN47_19060 [Gemmatimonadetes bacterium]|nr:hypothetical protein [Gemmatimonadota bacterium]MBK9978484.1 hypothetical protein [Gemmatimonadota bacterium]